MKIKKENNVKNLVPEKEYSFNEQTGDPSNPIKQIKVKESELTQEHKAFMADGFLRQFNYLPIDVQAAVFTVVAELVMASMPAGKYNEKTTNSTSSIVDGAKKKIITKL